MEVKPEILLAALLVRSSYEHVLSLATNIAYMPKGMAEKYRLVMDSHKHDAGDKCPLQSVAEMVDVLTETQIKIRAIMLQGGDEMAAIVKEHDASEAENRKLEEALGD